MRDNDLFGYKFVVNITKERQGGACVDNVKGLEGIKVMIIDDSNTIRRSAEIFLGQSGCEIILATDGFDAMAKIIDYQPDIIFVDIVMPRLDGYQTCMLIKKNTEYRSVPVIMLSSKKGLFDRARGRIAGSDDYLTKPFTKENLLSIAQKYTVQRNMVF
jgi:twitching motility two-component system response regulator PilG